MAWDVIFIWGVVMLCTTPIYYAQRVQIRRLKEEIRELSAYLKFAEDMLTWGGGSTKAHVEIGNIYSGYIDKIETKWKIKEKDNHD